MSKITFLHNPRCSKSRQTLVILEEKGITPEIVLYLEQTPSELAIAQILKKLGMPARQLLRKGEAEYKENGLSDESLTEEQLITYMHKYPKLIERPIVIKGDKAVIGRPPESVLVLL